MDDDIVLIPDFISEVGGTIEHPGEANDIDFVVRLPHSEATKSILESIYLLLRKRFDPEKRGLVHVLPAPEGPHGDYRPHYDLVLRRKESYIVSPLSLGPGLCVEPPQGTDIVSGEQHLISTDSQLPSELLTLVEGDKILGRIELGEPVIDDGAYMYPIINVEPYDYPLDWIGTEGIGFIENVIASGDAVFLRALGALKLVEPGHAYIAQKPAMAFYTDFKDVDEMWNNWAGEVVKQRGFVLVSPKVDGYRMSIQSDGKSATIWSEDFKRRFDHIATLLPAISRAGSFIIEGELQARRGNRFLNRSELASFLAGSLEADPEIYLYDLLYIEGKDISNEPFVSRLAELKTLAPKLGENFTVLPQQKASTPDEIRELATKFFDYGPPIEGIVARDPLMPYSFGPTNDYAKTKIYIELKVKVVNVNRKANGYTYTGALRSPEGDVVLGDTFVSADKLADVGDTLNVRIEELERKPDGSLAWHKPTPLGPDRSRPAYTADQAINLVRRYGRFSDNLSKSESQELIEPGANGETIPPLGPRDATLAVIGDGPGEIDARVRQPFSGPSGLFLKNILQELGADLGKVYWDNIYRRFGEAPKPEKTAKYGAQLLDDLSRLPNLKVILAVSTIAAEALTGSKTPSMSDARGKKYKSPNGIPIVVTYHPSALLRSGRHRSRFYDNFRADVAEAVKLARNVRELHFIPVRPVSDPHAVYSHLASGKPVKIEPSFIPHYVSFAADAPATNLMPLRVDSEKNIFHRHLTNRSRDKMPQLPEDAKGLAEFRAHLERKGFSVREESIDPRALVATQREIDSRKVAVITKYLQEHGGRLRDEGGTLIVSKEGGVVDGHHRWAATALYATMHPGTRVTILRVDADIHQVLNAAFTFPGTRTEGFAAPMTGAGAQSAGVS